MDDKRRCWIGFFAVFLVIAACSSGPAGFREQIDRLRSEVRGSFSFKFDPIWVGSKDKADEAKKEITRLIGVMDNALAALDRLDAPADLRGLHARHRDLFTNSRQALLQIQVEAGREKPDGMKAVKIYQEMSRRFLEMDAQGG